MVENRRFTVIIGILATALCYGQNVPVQCVPSFEALVASITETPVELKAAEEASRLRYAVSLDAVEFRKNQVKYKASLMDPGTSQNGKQSLRVAIARLDQDIHDRKALANILKTAPYNGKDASFSKISLAYIFGKYHDRLPENVQDAFQRQASAYKGYLERKTENHTGMQRVSAAIFGAAYPNMETCYGISGKELENLATRWIRDYSKTVYNTATREYLSPIYLAVHNGIWLTGAECGPTSSVRLMSQAMLDWIWTDLALNSCFGLVMPPVMRAKIMLNKHPQATFPNTNTQWMTWIYWGNQHSRPGQDELPAAAQSIYSGMTPGEMSHEGFNNAILSSVSGMVPNEIIRNIGAKNIALPYMVMQSRPSRFHYGAVADHNHDITQSEWNAEHHAREHLRSVYVARNYSLGGGYFLEDKLREEQYKHILHTALVYRSTDHFNSIYVSHPYWYAGLPHGNPQEATQVFGLDSWLGKSPYEQMLHWENTMIYMYDIPDEDIESARTDLMKAGADKWISSRREQPFKKVCFYVPVSIDETRKTEWGWFLREGDVYIALRKVGKQQETWESCTNPLQRGYKRLVTEGALQALIVEIGDAEEYGDPETFIAKIGEVQLDLSSFQSKKELRYVSTRGIPFEIRYNTEGSFPIASVKGVELDFEQWPVCESPYVNCRDGVLRVNDGSKGFSVDWSGDEPAYSYFNLNE